MCALKACVWARSRPLRVPSLPARGGPDVVRRAFEPLGWTVELAQPDLDPTVPRWGPSRHLDVTLTGTLTLSAALSHLYVLLPALDGTKHYWVSTDEVDKLVRAGGEWLATHPERELITRRYLAHRRELVTDALDRFAELDDRPPPDDAPDDLVSLLIGGEARPARDGRTFARHDPVTGQVASVAAAAGVADALAAAAAAQAAFPAWAATGPAERRRFLSRAADAMEAQADRFTAAMTAATSAWLRGAVPFSRNTRRSPGPSGSVPVPRSVSSPLRCRRALTLQVPGASAACRGRSGSRALRRPRPGTSRDTASNRLVLPEPFGPVMSAMRDAGRQVSAA